MNILIEKIEDADTQRLFEVGYDIVKKNNVLRKLPSVQRMAWIQGFVNGVKYGNSRRSSEKRSEDTN